MPLAALDIVLLDAHLAIVGPGRWLAVAVAFVLGAVIGSFMNVVVYRVPRGESLVHPGSHCPQCDHPIRWYDNVPIVGWLLLGGRCRDCKARISPRYPLVEALVAATSALLAWAALRPGEMLPPPDGTFVFWHEQYAVQSLLMAELVCMALIEWDGHVPPSRVWLPVGLLLFVASAVWPDLHSDGLGVAAAAPWRGALDAAMGLAAAALLGAIAWPTWVASARRSDILAGVSSVAALCLVGIAFGARDVAVVAGAAMGCYVATRLLAHVWRPAGRIGWAAATSIATLVYILARPLSVAPLPVLRDQPTMTILLVAGAVLATASVARWLGLISPRTLAP